MALLHFLEDESVLLSSANDVLIIKWRHRGTAGTQTPEARTCRQIGGAN